MPDNIVAVFIIAAFAALAFFIARLLSRRSDEKRRAREQEAQRASEAARCGAPRRAASADEANIP